MTDSPTKKFRILNISASDYIHSRNFPKTISNNPHLPEKPPHYYQVEIKPLSTEILSAQLKKEDLKNSYSMISAAIQENKLLYKQNLTIQEDNSKLSAVKKNLQNQVVEEVILKSDKRVRINDGFDIGEAEKVKRSGVINSNNSGESFRIKELEIELSLEKNKNCNLIQEKNELLNELAKMRSHLPGIRDPMVYSNLFF